MTRTRTYATPLIALVVVAATSGQGGDFDMSWHTVDGGGGTSSGGDFEITGTIGQADAGEMTGGDFELAGGFWAGSASVSVDCPADLNGDDGIDATDLASLLGAWGPNPGHPADLNGDGFVNAADLAALLGTWGPCAI